MGHAKSSWLQTACSVAVSLSCDRVVAAEELLTSLHPVLGLPAFISPSSGFVSFQHKAFALKSALMSITARRMTESLSALTDKLAWEWLISINIKYEIQK